MPEIIMLVAVVFGFMVAGGYVQARQRERKDRLRVLEEAIKSGQVDAETKRRIIESVQGDSGSRFWFGLGWIGFLVGLGMLVTGDRDLVAVGGIIAAAGLALVTLPIAYREIEAKRRV